MAVAPKLTAPPEINAPFAAEEAGTVFVIHDALVVVYPIENVSLAIAVR